MGGPQAIDIPLTGGLQENTDPKLMQGGLLRATNVFYRQREGLVPRYGTTLGPSPSAIPIGDTVVLPPPDGLAALGDRLVMTGAGKLFGFAEAYTQWALVGNLSQTLVTTEGVEASQTLQRDASTAIGGNVVVTVWSQQSDAVPTYRIFANVTDKTTGVTLSSSFVVSSTTNARPRPKVAFASSNSRFLVTWVEDSTTTVRCRVYTPITNSWGTVTTLVADYVATTGYAMCARAAQDTFLIAYHSSAATRRRMLEVTVTPSVTANLALTDAATDLTTCFGINCDDVGQAWIVYGRYDAAASTNGLKVLACLVDATTSGAPTLTLVPTTLYAGTLAGGADNAQYLVYSCTTKRYDATKAGFAWSITDDDIGSFGIIVRTATNTMTTAGALGSDSYAVGVTLATDLFAATFPDASVHMLYGVAPFESLAVPALGVIPALGNAYLLEMQNLNGFVFSYGARQQATYAVSQTEALSQIGGVGVTYANAAWPRSTSSLSAVYVDADGYYRWVGYDRQGGERPSRIHRAKAKLTGWTRQFAELGGKLLITGGTPALFDGSSVTEQAFQVIPEIDTSSTAAGPLTGTFQWVFCYEWTDDSGAVSRSAPSAPYEAALVARTITLGLRNDAITAKPSAASTDKTVVALVLYRTKDASSGPFYRVTAIDVPLANANSVASPFLSISDTMADADLVLNPQLYTTGGVLDGVCPPSAEHVAVWQGRYVLAGTDDDAIWYSTEYVAGETPRFNEALRFQPFSGGRVTAIGVLGDALIVFKSDTVFYITGTPPNDTGNPASSSLSAPTKIVADMGAIDPASIVLVPDGLTFRARRGIYLIDRSLSVSFLGEGVSTTTSDTTATITAGVLVPDQNQVRLSLTYTGGVDGVCLVWDYLTAAWTKFLYTATNGGAPRSAKYACMHRGRYAYVDSDKQLHFEIKTGWTDHGTVFVPTDVQTPWVRVGGVQGRQQAHRWSVLGTWGEDHLLTLTGYANYLDTADTPGSFPVPAAPTTGYQFVHPVKGPHETQSVSLRIQTAGNVGRGSGQPVTLSGVSLEVDKITNAQQRRLPTAQIG